MPTQMDFETAAHNFELAARGAGRLAAGADALPALSVLQGGLLSRDIPHGIARSSATARSCQATLESQALLCRERAAIIADYEFELERYNERFEHYMQREWAWSMRYLDWWDGLADYPGERPVQPIAPPPPPAWADVRRPR